ncbi:hypothetical protein [Pseudomonas sp. URMO17WK12:I4]|uniref:hypothetical protein n=1 Tax=Pseudomonas sp. URMO17WK12:I4 TaxID=1283292 RepID=UPI0004BBA868|nr:hypothetical protein [Pseudomonas sp. URMO17WK12:I4]
MLLRMGAAYLLLLHATVAMGALPYASGDVTRTECVEAMKLASAMFYSSAPRLYAPLVLPEGMKSRMLLGAAELDLSAGDALSSTEDFQRYPSGNRHLYWEAQTSYPQRLVLHEVGAGWRGDRYSLYWVDADVTPEDFLLQISDYASAARMAVVADSWRPPLVLQTTPEQGKWVIDFGQPFTVFANWQVYTSGAREATCTIAFTPADQAPEAGLPEPVLNLVSKLDKALGEGADEGTLQPTARVRLEGKHALANLSLRPWAISGGQVYSSRTQVEAGLAAWAEAEESNRQHHDQIKQLYSEAEQALADYYARTFGLPAQAARTSAAWNLDVLLRTFFAFADEQGGQKGETGTNPWPCAFSETGLLPAEV